MLFIQRETRKIRSNSASSTARGICIMHRIMCALVRVFFFPWKDGTVIRHGGQGKRIASNLGVARRSRFHIEKFRENDAVCIEKKGNSDAHIATHKLSSSRSTRETRLSLVEHRDYACTFRAEATDHLLLIDTRVFAAHTFYREK